MVVADPSASFFGGGGWAIAAFGIATVLLMAWVYARSTVRFILHASAIGLLTAGGLVAWSIDRPDVQLFVAIGGCTLVVVPNIVDELRHRSDDGELAG
jgi:hypothetical protein